MMLCNLKSVDSKVVMVSQIFSLLMELLLLLNVSFAKTNCINVIIRSVVFIHKFAR